MKTIPECSAKLCGKETCEFPKGRFVIVKDSATRIALADRKNGKILMDTLHTGSKEYSLLNTALLVGAVFLGAVCVAGSLKRNIQRKNELKMRTKEVNHLKKLCRKNGTDQKQR